MKILNEIVLFNKGNIKSQITPQLDIIHKSIKSVTNSGNKFILYNGYSPKSKRCLKHQNGVKPIKNNCINYLTQNNWKAEVTLDLGNTMKKPGPVDVVSPKIKNTNLPANGQIGLEWETGNISSSHRSLNRLTLGILHKKLAGGILLLPSRKMYYYLTDRIGNYEELEPYFPIWKLIGDSPRISSGYLSVIEFEYDELSNDINYKIPKGNDGRSHKN